MGKRPILAVLSATTILLFLDCGTPPEPTPIPERETRPADTPRPKADAAVIQSAAPAPRPSTRGESSPPASTPRQPTAAGPVPATSTAEPATITASAASTPDPTSEPTPSQPRAFSSVIVGSPCACSVSTDGAVDCRPRASPYRAARAPTGIFTSFSMGSHYGCGVRENGTLACWSYHEIHGNSHGQAVGPA